MAYRLNPQQFDTVSALSAPERFEHFVKRVVDCEEVWSLASPDGWVLMADDQGNQCVPLWPHEKYAEALAVGEWALNRPRMIRLSDFMDKWLPGMRRDGRKAAVFPTPNGKGVIVTPDRLLEALADECEEYE